MIVIPQSYPAWVVAALLLVYSVLDVTGQRVESFRWIEAALVCVGGFIVSQYITGQLQAAEQGDGDTR